MPRLARPAERPSRAHFRLTGHSLLAAISPFYGTATTMPTMQCNVTPANLNSVDAEVTGRATLTGRVSVTMTGTFTPGTTYTLLNADVGVFGTFSTESINFPPGQNFTPKIIYDTHHVKLYLQPNNPSGF